MPGGPQAMSRNDRMQFARDIARRALTLHQQHVLAIGLYGSMARGTDGPYSDIEMMCVLRDSDEDYSHEWSYGPGKAEVNVCGQAILMKMAAEVDGDWSLTHGAFCHVLPLHDPDEFFVELRHTVLSVPQKRFAATIHALIVGELYELIGKLRNAQHTGHTAYLPKLATDTATHGAFLIGLTNRYLYTTGARMLEESLTLSDRPSGYDPLCQMVMAGDLNVPNRITDQCEAFWDGVERWAERRGICIEAPDRIPF